MKKKYKVVIVGAGPSGISTALNLVKLGISDVLVVEKYKFPRYKCCAGYITSKTMKVFEEMGLDASECHYSLIRDFNIFYKLNLKQTIVNKFMYTNRYIDRTELDNAFYELAVSKGVEVLCGVSACSNDDSKNCIYLSNGKCVNYDYLVFADGFNSAGNKYQNNFKKNIAMQMVFESDKKEEIQIHFGVTKRGYAWVSSLNGVTNVGFTDVFDKNVNYNEVFKSFLSDLNFDVDTKNLKGAFTPIGVRKPIVKDNIFFVGDAVGACDPLTLSGLRYGLKTGEYCARAIAWNKNSIYTRYIRNMGIRFSFMKVLLKVFYLKSSLFCIFEIGCRFFGRMVSAAFNNFFVNKK